MPFDVQLQHDKYRIVQDENYKTTVYRNGEVAEAYASPNGPDNLTIGLAQELHDLRIEHDKALAKLSASADLAWLYAHCKTIGMDCPTTSGKPEHEIAKFTIALTDELKAAEMMIAMLEEGEWAEHAGAGSISNRLEAAITKLHNELADEHKRGVAEATLSLPEQQSFSNWAAYSAWRNRRIAELGEIPPNVDKDFSQKAALFIAEIRHQAEHLHSLDPHDSDSGAPADENTVSNYRELISTVRAELKPSEPERPNSIWITATNDEGRIVYRGSRSTSNASADVNLMTSFLELEQAWRLRKVDFGSHQIGLLHVSPVKAAIPKGKMTRARHDAIMAEAERIYDKVPRATKWDGLPHDDQKVFILEAVHSLDSAITPVISKEGSPQMQVVDWNELSRQGLHRRINEEILHPLGLAVMRDPDTGISAGALVSEDGSWTYGTTNFNMPLAINLEGKARQMYGKWVDRQCGVGEGCKATRFEDLPEKDKIAHRRTWKEWVELDEANKQEWFAAAGKKLAAELSLMPYGVAKAVALATKLYVEHMTNVAPGTYSPLMPWHMLSDDEQHKWLEAAAAKVRDEKLTAQGGGK